MQVNGNVGVLASIAACIRALRSGVGVPILSSDECIRFGEEMDETVPFFFLNGQSGHSNPNDVDQTFTFNGRLEKNSWCKALKLHRPQSSTGFSVAKHEFHLDKMVFGQG